MELSGLLTVRVGFAVRYPGCACDIPSASYQFTWERNPNWSQYYSESPEIWRYFKDVVDKHGLIKYVKLEHKIVGAYWKPEDGVWEVRVQRPDGTEFVDTCNVLVNGGGVLKYVDPIPFSSWSSTANGCFLVTGNGQISKAYTPSKENSPIVPTGTRPSS